MKHTIIDNRTEINRLKAENARLKAEVERLTKELENTDCMFAMASAFARDWNAAKEGKGQP
jgi:cell division protein FtsB